MASGKIYAISDLHVDQLENMKWVEGLSDGKYLNDTIIVAGDITHVLSKLALTLKALKSKFKDVYYCPGNHELWTQSCREDNELQVDNSIEKFHHIIELCDTIGVRTRPGITEQGVTIIPLFGWYDESLHIPGPELESDIRLWSDYHRCVWTDVSEKRTVLFYLKCFLIQKEKTKQEVPRGKAAEYFVKLNEANLLDFQDKTKHPKIITFSHFLTSKKLMEAYRDEMQRRRAYARKSEKQTAGEQERTSAVRKANFSLVAGTELLDKQLQVIKPQIHIFGHSHRKMILNIGDEIRYVNNPLGYTYERDSRLIEPPYELYEIVL
ncbi:unnamed protein product [Adineta ricciae]|uniref:Calcineurin-like phosphoesterase domain-containing protein n=1 Tax=Adineta ricciae TaxID=249248 RepID=A0A814L0E0_ADIRI|nr:unnamed protein product [Adineta ricciae]CAF1250095.1 unnamed protein product [Adineta ricciae]